MQRQTEQRLAAEALEPIDRRTVPQADGTMAVDGARYTSTAALAFRTDNGSPTETRAARLGRWSSELIQFLPLLVFVNTGRLGLDCQERFLIGAGAAPVVVTLLAALRVRTRNPVVG